MFSPDINPHHHHHTFSVPSLTLPSWRWRGDSPHHLLSPVMRSSVEILIPDIILIIGGQRRPTYTTPITSHLSPPHTQLHLSENLKSSQRYSKILANIFGNILRYTVQRDVLKAAEAVSIVIDGDNLQNFCVKNPSKLFATVTWNETQYLGVGR